MSSFHYLCAWSVELDTYLCKDCQRPAPCNWFLGFVLYYLLIDTTSKNECLCCIKFILIVLRISFTEGRYTFQVVSLTVKPDFLIISLAYMEDPTLLKLAARITAFL